MRLFSGTDWIETKEEHSSRMRSASKPVAKQSIRFANNNGESKSEKLHPQSQTSDMVSNKNTVSRKQKLLDALLDNYVPSPQSTDTLDNMTATSTPTQLSGFRSENTIYHGDDTHAFGTSRSGRRNKLQGSGRKTEEMLELMLSNIKV